MAKSVKKVSGKAAKKAAGSKATGKVAKKTVKKTAKKVAKKATKVAIKKTARKSTKKSSPVPTKRSGKIFLVIYHAPLDAMAQTANVTSEQQAAGMALWQAWAERVGSKLLDLGAPLMNGKRLAAGSSPSPSTKEVAGYSLLSADDWDDVMSLLEGHPHISGWHPEATIEIHETMELPGM